MQRPRQAGAARSVSGHGAEERGLQLREQAWARRERNEGDGRRKRKEKRKMKENQRIMFYGTVSGICFVR